MKRGCYEKCQETSPSPTRLSQSVHIHIPLDLIVEILKKLPTKSLVRFQCISKLWSSIISSSRDFIDSIVTRSLSQPPRDAHLILTVSEGCVTKFEWLLVFTSGTSPPITNKVSLLSIHGQFTDKVPGNSCQYVRGLILCWSYTCKKTAIYNPTTRQCFPLPKREASGTCFFVYDPLMNLYKVLLLPFPYLKKTCQVTQVLTLGEKQWRTIQGAGSRIPVGCSVCFNGVLYYLAKTSEYYTFEYKLMSFDVKSEKFNHVDAPTTLMDHYYSSLVNYQGKLGFVCCMEAVEIWVMDDLKTQKWSKMFFYEMDDFRYRPIVGATRDGEIVLFNWGKDSVVLYYDPKRNSMRSVKLINNTKSCSVSTIPDYVENTMRLF